MTLFIAVVLLYHFDMGWAWYAVATALWAAHGLANPVILDLLDNR